MQLCDLFEHADLREALSRVSTSEMWSRVTRRIRGWTKAMLTQAKADIIHDHLAAYEEIEAQVRRIENDNGWEAADKLRIKASNIRDDMYQRFGREVLTQRYGFESFKAMLEDELQRIARDHIESTLGPIDPFIRDLDYDSQVSKHLYHLQHIVVSIRIGAVNPKTGRPKTGGGAFYKNFGRNENFDTEYVRTNVDFMNDLGVGIVLFEDGERVLHVIADLLVNEFSEEIYGEPMRDDPLPSWLPGLLDTYVHEVAHLEQDARLRINRQRTGRIIRDAGITYTPAPGKKRVAYQYDGNSKPPALMRGPDNAANRDRSSRTYKAGKRGNPDHLSDEDYSDPARMTDYYGTAHEIEAHAAGAATFMLMQFERDRYRDRWRRSDDRVAYQRAINEFIDTSVADLKSGYWPEHHSVQQMQQLMRNKIEQVSGLAKSDIGYRKVWRLFMTKLVRHLMAHHKDIPWADGDDWRREAVPEPRPARVGGIIHPARKPEIP